MSDDGRHGLSIIALIGSVFSPYYALQRRRGKSDALDHVAMNVALYSRNGKRWAMTERGRNDLTRAPDSLAIGPSRLAWSGDGLTIDIDEIAVPLPRRVKGRVKLYPSALQPKTFALDAGGLHVWQPIAPVARVEVEFEHPALSWRGHGYFDRNAGAAPLEDAFQRWHWSRSGEAERSLILYDVTTRAGEAYPLALDIGKDGVAKPFEPPPVAVLPSTYWRIARTTRSDSAHPARVVKTLEDAPFYARSIVSSRIDGRAVSAMHESLDLDRFNMKIVQAMLPFRMPRHASASKGGTQR
ncbi:MAG: hypothetical protein ABL907_08760 [Hyphomicrobium sp.]